MNKKKICHNCNSQCRLLEYIPGVLRLLIMTYLHVLNMIRLLEQQVV